METALVESQTDSCFPTLWSNGYPKQKYVRDPHIQRRTITKINHDRRTALERSVKSISLGGLKSILRGHTPRPYFCSGLDTEFVQSARRLPNSSVLHLREHKKSRLSPVTVSWTLVTISGVVTVRGPPEWGSTSRLFLPCLNSVAILLYGSIWSDILSQCCYNNSMNSLRCWSLFMQILITMRSAILSILQTSCVLFIVTCYNFDIRWPNNTGCWLHNCNKASQAKQTPRTSLLGVGKHWTGESDDI